MLAEAGELIGATTAATQATPLLPDRCFHVTHGATKRIVPQFISVQIVWQFMMSHNATMRIVRQFDMTLDDDAMVRIVRRLHMSSMP
jgi:hypothetical protein